MAQEHGAVDLALGAPDFPPPAEVVQSAVAALRGETFTYPDPWGTPTLRQAIARSLDRHWGLAVDARAEVTVTCGATEGVFLALMATTQPGDEVLCFEPGYEGYEPAIAACGATARHVRLHRPPAGEGTWSFDPAEVARTCTRRTRVLLLNSPHNPTGKVFGATELQLLAELCWERELTCISDEIYSHMVFGGRRHVSVMQLKGMRERTFLVNSFSKTFGIPGWRLGYVAAQPPLSAAVRAAHDVVAAGVAAPFQQAAEAALELPDSYFTALAQANERRRSSLLRVLESVGVVCHPPEGTWYLLADFSPLGFAGNDHDFGRFLIRDLGVAAVPGSAFFAATPGDGRELVRFCFGKSEGVLAAAAERLSRLPLYNLRTHGFARGGM
jgi:aminotransferase